MLLERVRPAVKRDLETVAFDPLVHASSSEVTRRDRAGLVEVMSVRGERGEGTRARDPDHREHLGSPVHLFPYDNRVLYAKSLAAQGKM